MLTHIYQKWLDICTQFFNKKGYQFKYLKMRNGFWWLQLKKVLNFQAIQLIKNPERCNSFYDPNARNLFLNNLFIFHSFWLQNYLRHILGQSMMSFYSFHKCFKIRNSNNGFHKAIEFYFKFKTKNMNFDIKILFWIKIDKK